MTGAAGAELHSVADCRVPAGGPETQVPECRTADATTPPHMARLRLLLTVVSLIGICLYLPVSNAETTGYMPGGTAASKWARNIVLCYMDERTLTQPEFQWSAEKFEVLVAYSDGTSGTQDTFFDGVLLLGMSWAGRAFWPNTSKEIPRKEEWLGLGDNFVSSGVKNLDSAVTAVRKDMGGMPEVQVMVMLPYPDPQQLNWGDGLSFANAQDRVSALKWYIDYISAEVSKLETDGVVLTGFYWYLEEVSLAEDKSIVLPQTAQYLHSKNLLFTWIPYFEAAGYDSWQEYGFDWVTIQPNYAFHNSSKQRFADVSHDAIVGGMGVEMELPLAVRNPQIVGGWEQNFHDYLNAAKEYMFEYQALLTYYYGNVYYDMSIDPTKRPFYDLLYKFVKRML